MHVRTAQHGDAGRNSGLDHGLALFGQLVCNKIFLLSFIRTLEQRSDFIVRDKVNVASLVCVALHSRLDYLTESVPARFSQSMWRRRGSLLLINFQLNYN